MLAGTRHPNSMAMMGRGNFGAGGVDFERVGLDEVADRDLDCVDIWFVLILGLEPPITIDALGTWAIRFFSDAEVAIIELDRA